MNGATPSGGRAGRLTAAAALAATVFVFAAGASVAGVSGDQEAPALFGLPPTTSSSTSTSSSTTSSSTTSSSTTTTVGAPAAPTITIDPAGASAQPDPQAEDGSALAVQGSYDAPCGCAGGTYVLTGRLRGEGARGRLTVNGARVGEWALAGSYREVQAVVALSGPDATIGVESVAPQPGAQPNVLLVDWLRLTPSAPQYTTVGRDVRAPGGYPTLMRGVAKGGFEYSPFGDNVGEDDVAGLMSWGAGVVRLFVSQEFSDPRSCRFDSDYAARVQAEVDRLNSRGIYVIINDNHSQRGDPCALGGNFQMADDGAVPFWSEMANRYKDHPLVGFDLYNEPHDVSWEVWRNGGDAGGFHTPGMQALHDVVRSAGATNLVFVTGPSWGNDLRPALEMPIDGSGIVYAAHAYCFECARDADGTPSYLTSWVAPAAAEHPVAILEFGSAAYDAGAHNRRIIDWAKDHGIGWTAYSWSRVFSGNPWGLIRPSGGYQPSLNGLPVYNALRGGVA